MATKAGKSYPIGKVAGASAAKLLGDKRLAKAIYRLAPRKGSGAKYGLPGLLLKREGYGAEYAGQPCLCGRPLSFGRLSLFSDGNSAARLVHFVCAQRAMTWARLEMFAYGPIVLGASYAIEKTVELRAMAAIWTTYNRHMEGIESEAKVLPNQDPHFACAIVEEARNAVAEAIGEIAA